MQALLDAIALMPLPTDAQPIFHGRGGLHPGCEHWTLDAFPPVFVLTSFLPATETTETTETTEQELATIGAALAARWQQLAPGEGLSWVFQCRSAAPPGGQSGRQGRLITLTRSRNSAKRHSSECPTGWCRNRCPSPAGSDYRKTARRY